MGLIGQLKQRKIVQWSVAYAAAAFALLQGLDMIGQKFGWPDTVGRVLIIAAFVGFFVTLVLAWYHGERGAQKVSTTELLILALLLAIGGALAWRFAPSPGNVAAPLAAASAPPPTANDQSIAVLPFENLSDDKANEYFVSGMQDMILTSLSKLRGLKVISRTSTEKYASRPENLRQVAAELGVAHILEGSVQRVGDQVLINLQLIDARSDTHLWADSYDRRVTDVFSVEREVAGVVAESLRTTLLPAARSDLGQSPTANAQALDLFLQGEFEVRRGTDTVDAKPILAAIAHYEQAVALDPGFALAWARLAQARLLRYWTGGTTPDPAFAAAAQQAAARASQLAPDLPEVKLALADLQYRVGLDYRGALGSYDAVLAQRPQSVDALRGRGQALRRLGRFDEAIAAFSTAIALDPRDSTQTTDRGITYFLAGRLAAAEADLRRALQLNPQANAAQIWLSQLLLYRDGEPARALAVLTDVSDATMAARVRALLCAREFDTALAALHSGGRESTTEDAAIEADVLALAGRGAQARRVLQSQIDALRQQVASLPENSGSGQVVRFRLAMAEAHLGHEALALQQVQRGLDLLPPEKDLANGSIGLGEAARVYGVLGRTDLLLPMLARIRGLDGTDTLTSAATLRLDPAFDAVRADPGFQAEVRAFAARNGSR